MLPHSSRNWQLISPHCRSTNIEDKMTKSLATKSQLELGMKMTKSLPIISETPISETQSLGFSNHIEEML